MDKKLHDSNKRLNVVRQSIATRGNLQSARMNSECHDKKSISSRSSFNIFGASSAARRSTSGGGLRFMPVEAGARYDGGFVFEAGFVVFEGGLVALEGGLTALDAGFLTGDGIGCRRHEI